MKKTFCVKKGYNGAEKFIKEFKNKNWRLS